MEHESFFRKPEQQEDSEPSSFTVREQAILNALTPEDKSIARALHQQNLDKHRTQIVGFRSEDYLYLLKSIHNGFLPVGNSPIRTKWDSSDYLFITPNPESACLQEEYPELFQQLTQKHSTFAEETLRNNAEYGNIGKIQAIYRNIWPYIDEANLVKSLQLVMEPDVFEENFHMESFLRGVVREIEGSPDTIDCRMKRRYRMTGILEQSLAPHISRDEVNTLLRSLSQREGIVLAFNEKLLRERIVHQKDVTHLWGEEVAVHYPEGKIPLDTILGYEILGEFEDTINAQAGI